MSGGEHEIMLQTGEPWNREFGGSRQNDHGQVFGQADGIKAALYFNITGHRQVDSLVLISGSVQ